MLQWQLGFLEVPTAAVVCTSWDPQPMQSQTSHVFNSTWDDSQIPMRVWGLLASQLTLLNSEHFWKSGPYLGIEQKWSLSDSSEAARIIIVMTNQEFLLASSLLKLPSECLLFPGHFETHLAHSVKTGCPFPTIVTKSDPVSPSSENGALNIKISGRPCLENNGLVVTERSS